MRKPIILAATGILVAALLTLVLIFKKEAKYRIISNGRHYTTNSYEKTSDGCIKFKTPIEETLTVCGNYIIEER
jgi:hypothetical protein